MKTAGLHRITFSSNDRLAINQYELSLEVCKKDLEEIRADLREGLRVLIWEPGELEMEATLHFNRDHDCWVATGDESTIVDLDELDRPIRGRAT